MLSTFDIPARLKELREASGMTQEAFAEHAGMGYKFYQHIEAGRKRLLRIDTIERICLAYKISLCDFFKPKCPKIQKITSPIKTKRKPRK